MEVYDDGLKETMKYYHSGADMPFNFQFVHNIANKDMTEQPKGNAQDLHDLIKEWMDKMPTGKWPNWVVSVMICV